MGIRRVVAAALVSAAALSGLAACTGDDKGSQPTTLPTVTSSASSPPSATSPNSPSSPVSPTAVEQVSSQWKKYWSVYLALQGADPGQIAIELEPLAGRQQIANVVKAISDLASQGRKQVGGDKFGELSVSVSGATAVVQECRNLSDAMIVDAAGNVVQANFPSAQLSGNYELGADGVWRLSYYLSEGGQC